MTIRPLSRTAPAAVRTAWEAIRVPRFPATLAMHRYHGELGPIFVSPAERALYFLVPAGTVTEWQVDGTCGIAAAGLVLPRVGSQRPPGPYWLLPPRQRRLTDPSELRRVLDDIERAQR